MEKADGAREMELNLEGCTEVRHLHERIRQTFGFPAHYGANLDALWDMGHDYIGTADGQQEWVRIEGVDTLSPELKVYFLEKVMRVLRDLEQEKGNIHFEVESREE